MEVSAWLQALGLETYAQAFADNDVDWGTLRLLTDADLHAIGVTSLGHRRKITSALAALRDDAEPASIQPSIQPPIHAPVPGTILGPGFPAASTGALPTPSARSPAGASSAGSNRAEYRSLSVLACERVRTETLEHAHDPEDDLDAIRDFNHRISLIVADHQGCLVNAVGDDVFIYFGWPRANEDDTERAARAGLQILQVFGPASVRVGIATGLVVVGDIESEIAAPRLPAAGFTLQLAALLRGAALPGQVLVDKMTCRLLGRTFECAAVALRSTHGLEDPPEAFSVVRERNAETRFDARQGGMVGQMIGRDQELALLKERWAIARGGEGIAILVVGEAGIGKSRLVRSLLDSCGVDGPYTLVRWQCSPYHSGSALWPVMQHMSRAAGLDPGEDAQQSREKLRSVVDDDEELAVHASLLGLAESPRHGQSVPASTPADRERMLMVLTASLHRRAGSQPLLLVVEDAHWIDPTTLDLIERSLEKLDSSAMLVLITSRPVNQPRLAAHPRVTQLTLNRLSRACVEAMVASLAGDTLQPQTKDAIVAQTDGVPLFVEELTKAMLETGEAAVPMSLHGSLMARLDRVPQVREVAQIAACIGREFDPMLLMSVAEHPASVRPALEKLVQSELVYKRARSETYVFKHALVQEIAYECLLRAKRREIHARIVQVLTDTRADTPPEILAHHADRAGLVDPALAWWEQAGDGALAKSAYLEAGQYFERATQLIRREVNGVDRRGAELSLQLKLAQSYRAAQGLGAEGARQAFERAFALIEADPSKASLRFRVQYGLWSCEFSRARLDSALEQADRALSDARDGGSRDEVLGAHRMVATIRMLLGDFSKAQEHFEQSADIVRSASSGEAHAGLDPAIAYLGWLALMRHVQGLTVQGNDLLAQARGIAAAESRINARLFAHLYGALCAACLHDPAAMASHVQVLSDLATRHSLAMHKGHARCLQAWMAAEAENPDPEVIAQYEKGISQLRAAGSRLYIAFFTSALARALGKLHRFDEALESIGHALDECRVTKQGWCEAELHRVHGELLLKARQDQTHARSCFEEALAMARSRGARLWELRAATSLARLRAMTEDPLQALRLIRPVILSFPEDLDTPDLRAARSLTLQLESSQTAGVWRPTGRSE